MHSDHKGYRLKVTGTKQTSNYLFVYSVIDCLNFQILPSISLPFFSSCHQFPMHKYIIPAGTANHIQSSDSSHFACPRPMQIPDAVLGNFTAWWQPCAGSLFQNLSSKLSKCSGFYCIGKIDDIRHETTISRIPAFVAYQPASILSLDFFSPGISRCLLVVAMRKTVSITPASSRMPETSLFLPFPHERAYFYSSILYVLCFQFKLMRNCNQHFLWYKSSIDLSTAFSVNVGTITTLRSFICF